MPNVERDLITTSEAAVRLNVSRQTIVNWAKSGLLPYAHQHPGNGAYMFDPDVIETERKRRLAKQREIVNALEGAE